MISFSVRYIRKGECNHCGACCLTEDPPCPHLEWDGKITRCAIFEKPELPMRCGLFPELPPIPFKSCGYYFLDTWEENKIVREKV